MKNVLILTASTGGGHNEAASSLEKEFSKHGFTVKKIDALFEINKTLDSLIINSCKVLTNNFPRLYGSLYDFSNYEKANKIITNSFSKISREKIYDIILREEPDLIISTHTFMVSVICYLKSSGFINIPYIAVITDYEAHRSYINQNVDAYIAASEYTSRTLIKQGIPKNKIYSYGIPIKKEFLNNFSSNPSKSSSFQILLMAGSLGMKGMKKILKNIVYLDGNYNIVVVCGNNIKLKKSIEKEFVELIQSYKITLYGFSNNIPFIMGNSDIIITKPGGLTISEAIAKKLPMIIPFYIPGQEKENLDYLLSEGVAIYVPEIDRINTIIQSLINNPETLDSMEEKMKEMYNKYCLDNIINLGENLIKEYNYGINLKYGSFNEPHFIY